MRPTPRARALEDRRAGARRDACCTLGDYWRRKHRDVPWAHAGAPPRWPPQVYIGSRFARAQRRRAERLAVTLAALAQTGVEGSRGSLRDGGYGKKRVLVRRTSATDHRRCSATGWYHGPLRRPPTRRVAMADGSCKHIGEREGAGRPGDAAEGAVGPALNVAAARLTRCPRSRR